MPRSFVTVITASQSRGIGDGLTYETDDDTIVPGSVVRAPLRKSVVEGIVLEVSNARAATEYDLRTIQGVLGDAPLLSEAQMRTVRWMAAENFCSLRQALNVWLPAKPWSKLVVLEKDEAVYAPFAMKRSVLSPKQKEVADSLLETEKPSLLFGITGSGKTEIYAELIAKTAAAGRQTILLVPEILLASQIVERFSLMLPPERVAVIHSRLKPKQRREEWKRIHEGTVTLVIGSRSALFSPARNLGLVILDEEHEWTYKNEQTPRYHARSTAEALCRFSGAKLVLGSATPSLESWSRAKTGVYHLARLPDRFGGAELPTVRIVDLAQTRFGKHYPLSPELITAVGERLQKGEQSVLFLNRRGAASALLCLDCRRRVISPHSQLPFTVHHGPGGAPYLLDHTTGIRQPLPAACPHCKGSNLLEVGAGTQRVESLLTELFPKAKLLRADTDSLKKPEEIMELLSEMRQGKGDILLGTQSVVKGLDLPNVTLAAVLIADIGLSLPHFRAGERIFELLTQLSGRSGRTKPGDVIIQTFRPDAPEVVAAARHETEQYLETELKMRTHAQYPPMTPMIRLLTRGPGAEARARTLHTAIMRAALSAGHEIKASVAPTLFGAGKEWHVLIRGSHARAIVESLTLENVVVDNDPIDTV